jgi:16S rRNA (adenine1518-N6/adenine1519-N6)-dimethyltransferase
MRTKKRNGVNPKNLQTGFGDFRPKKHFGQNFLKSQVALNKMCEAGKVCSNDIILEIGPGKGALTEKLLEKAKKVFAVEKDDTLVEFLKEKFKNEVKIKKIEIINEDILNFDLKKYGFKNCKYKIIANIPYNITGAILKNFLSNNIQPKKMILLVQKEVAERIVARGRKESILSLSVKVYGSPKYEMKVSKKYFSPSPKVDSAIINIENISRKNFKSKKEEEVFFELIKSGFAHKRKLVHKNIENIFNKYGGFNGEKLKNFGIDKNARAEDINFEKWLEISEYLSTKN